MSGKYNHWLEEMNEEEAYINEDSSPRMPEISHNKHHTLEGALIIFEHIRRLLGHVTAIPDWRSGGITDKRSLLLSYQHALTGAYLENDDLESSRPRPVTPSIDLLKMEVEHTTCTGNTHIIVRKYEKDDNYYEVAVYRSDSLDLCSLHAMYIRLCNVYFDDGVRPLSFSVSVFEDGELSEVDAKDQWRVLEESEVRVDESGFFYRKDDEVVAEHLGEAMFADSCKHLVLVRNGHAHDYTGRNGGDHKSIWIREEIDIKSCYWYQFNSISHDGFNHLALALTRMINVIESFRKKDGIQLDFNYTDSVFCVLERYQVALADAGVTSNEVSVDVPMGRINIPAMDIIVNAKVLYRLSFYEPQLHCSSEMKDKINQVIWNMGVAYK